MGTQTRQITAQVIVGIIVGCVTGLMAGSGTAYIMMNDLRQDLTSHIVSNESTQLQLRRDVTRLEQYNLHQDRDDQRRDEGLQVMAIQVAVIADWVTDQKHK